MYDITQNNIYHSSTYRYALNTTCVVSALVTTLNRDILLHTAREIRPPTIVLSSPVHTNMHLIPPALSQHL